MVAEVVFVFGEHRGHVVLIDDQQLAQYEDLNILRGLGPASNTNHLMGRGARRYISRRLMIRIRPRPGSCRMYRSRDLGRVSGTYRNRPDRASPRRTKKAGDFPARKPDEPASSPSPDVSNSTASTQVIGPNVRPLGVGRLSIDRVYRLDSQRL